jgi:hypothetical protein
MSGRGAPDAGGPTKLNANGRKHFEPSPFHENGLKRFCVSAKETNIYDIFHIYKYNS